MNVEGWVIICDNQHDCHILFRSEDDARATLEHNPAGFGKKKARIVHMKEIENENLMWRYHNDGPFRAFVERMEHERLEREKERAG